MILIRHAKILSCVVLALAGLCTDAYGQVVITTPDTAVCAGSSVTLNANYVGRAPNLISLPDDKYSSVVTIPFPFTFYGNTYTQCVISSNGFISFNTSLAGQSSIFSVSSSPYPNSSSTQLYNTIMACYADLYPNNAGDIDWAVVGTAPNRMFIATWCNMPYFLPSYCPGSLVVVQAVLHEGTNIIDINTRQKGLCSGSQGGRAVQGIQNSSTIGHIVPGRNAPTQWTALNSSYQFTPGQGNTYTISSIPYYFISRAAWYLNNTTFAGVGNSITVTPTTTSFYTYRTDCADNFSDTVNISIITGTPPAPGIIAGNTSPCIGAPTTYSITPVSGATSYTWTTPAGWSGTSTTTSLTTTPSGTAGNVTVTATTACGTSAASTLPVTPISAAAAPGAITGPTSVCAGATLTYSVPSGPTGTTYTWTLPPGWTGSSTTSSITVTASSSSGTVSVTATNACGLTSSLTNLAVTSGAAAPAPGPITGPTAVCSGVALTYSVTPVSGATSYTWTLPTGWSGTSSTSSITTTPTGTGGTITVVANAACGASSQQTLAVTASSIPSGPGTISGATAVCNGVAQTYSVPAVPGATSYDWTLPAGWVGTSSSSSITTTPTSTGGSITVTASNYCGTSATSSLVVSATSIPSAPTTVTGSTAVCSGVPQTYTAATTPGATSYTWTLPVGWSGTSSSSSISATPTGTGGTVSVSATNYCGTSTPATLAVSSTTAPAQPGNITGTTAVCAGVQETYTIAAVPGATNYTWTLPTGWSGSSTGTSITATPGNTGGTIAVTASNSCGTSTQQTLVVNSASAPASPGTIAGATAVCSGVAQTYSITPVAGASSYTWTLPTGWSGSSSTSTITAIPTSGGGTITVVANASCGTSTPQTLTVNSANAPAAPGAITGAVAVCSGAQQTYSVAPVTGAVSYTWTLPVGWIGTSTGPSITVTPSATSGTISVTAVSTCGASAPSTLSVSASAIPAQPGLITGPTTPCVGTSQTYSVAAVSGATSYTWTLPGTGWTGTSTTPSLFTPVGTAAGNITVTASNSCGTSVVRTLAVTPVSVPTQPTVITGSATPCVGAANTYAVPAVSGATSYNWTLPIGWSGASTSSTISTIPSSLSSGTISVTASNVCGTSAPQFFAVSPMTTPAQPGAISIPPSTCQAASGVYSIASVPGATSYTWSLPSGWSGGGSSNAITVTAGTSGTISVTANNVCGASAPSNTFVLVAPLPVLNGSISGPASLCISSPVVYTAPAATNALSYVWTLSSGLSGSSTTGSISTSAAAAGSGTVTVAAVNGCGSSAPVTLAVTVNPTTATAVSVVSSLSNGAVCPGVPATFTALSTGAGTSPSYTWTRNGSVQTGITGSTFTITNPQNGEVISVQMASGAACPSPAIATSTPLTISVLPSVIPGINVNTQYSNVPTICSTTQLNFTANIVGGGPAPVYQWRRNGAIVGTNSPTYSAASWNNGDTVWAILTSSAQCATPTVQPSNKIGVTVGAPITPTVSITASPGTTFVPGQAVTFTATVTGGGPSPAFQWMRNNQNILGAYGPTYTTSSLTGGETISVRLTSSDLCVTTPVVFSNNIVMSSSTAVQDMNSSAGISLYPNPNEGVFTLSLAGSSDGGRTSIDILNALGQVVWHREVVVDRVDWTMPVAIRDVAAGVYLLRLRNEDGRTATLRFDVRK